MIITIRVLVLEWCSPVEYPPPFLFSCFPSTRDSGGKGNNEWSCCFVLSQSKIIIIRDKGRTDNWAFDVHSSLLPIYSYFHYNIAIAIPIPHSILKGSVIMSSLLYVGRRRKHFMLLAADQASSSNFRKGINGQYKGRMVSVEVGVFLFSHFFYSWKLLFQSTTFFFLVDCFAFDLFYRKTKVYFILA